MSESLNRKACDRCHNQKLSCKRIGKGVCDRCLRLNAECKSSPSLRYKKQIQHYDQIQEHQQLQHQQQPPPLPLTQSPDQAQQLLQHYYSRELLQQQQPLPQLAYSQEQSTAPNNALYSEEQDHSEAEDGTERRCPKRRRKGSDAHPVQRDTATDAMSAPGIPSQVMTVPDGSAGLAEYAMNLRNMDYMALSQPPMLPNYLLGSQVPSGVVDYFPFHQVNPSFWPHQSHEEAQQLQHHHLVLHHHQPQQVFDQDSFAPFTPLVIPDPAVAQQDPCRSVHPPPQQDLLVQDRATLVFGSRKRQSAPPPHPQTFYFPATKSRSRSNIVRVNYKDSVTPNESNLAVMDQFLLTYTRVRLLANHLECLKQGKDYRDGPGGKPNEFTVAELYKHTHYLIEVLERIVAMKRASSDSAPGQAELPLSAMDPSNCMLTVSLYAQLLKTLQHLFDHVRAVLADADPKLDDTFDSYLLPVMNFGIATGASLDTHPALHMSLTVQVGMQYLGRLRDATAFLGLTQGPETNGHGAHGPGALESQNLIAGSAEISSWFSNIMKMEGNLSKTLGQLQDELNDFMDAMDVIDAKEEREKNERK
ncbi:hypothetical protein BM221_001910 [Beauveria bassiana]|uniref:Zn(2)-C6 fungal-type domain-containing protein n=1 Tax=Beauveria bassiana TaxID=176275 RepID=A0A2N6NX05_BEABA|nr:hypothetical protein BM221_001910 [Beauveria bassiana]